MNQLALIALRGSPNPHWQLAGAVPTGAEWTLLSWDDVPAGVDAGVPTTVAKVVARALAAVARVTFSCSSLPCPTTAGWVASVDDMALCLQRSGRVDRATAWLAAQPQRISVLSTQRATAIERLFDDPGFPWWMQAQAALLSPSDAPPPALDFALMAGLLHGDRVGHAELLRREGVQALLCPAVDGDAMGLLSLTGDVAERFLDAMADAAAAAHLAWSIDNRR